MKHFYWALFILMLNVCRVSGQQQAPHVSGKLEISFSDGLIKGDFQLSKLPGLGKQYKILLNRGLNIGLLKNDSGKVLQYSGFYNDKLIGEAAAYYPVADNDTLSLPQKLSISYTGAFPIYTDTLNSFDFKGMIALNGKTLRAAEQSKWYPVIYDVKNDKELLDVTYDIDVECKDCQTIYINGSRPQSGPAARFVSAVPRQLLLFAGNYKAQVLDNSTFLNADLSPAEAKVFNDNIAFITNFYKAYLSAPYGDKVTLLQHKAVETYGPSGNWGFVTFPTIAVAGETFKSQLDMQKGTFKDTSNYTFYAHEMGHYYFGHLLQPNSTLKWFFLESMAEFLSIKAGQKKYGEVFLRNYISKAKAQVKDWKIKPLPTIVNPDNLGEGYRYIYGPLILLAMEKRFGPGAVEQFCRKALQKPGMETNYNYLLTIVKDAGIKDADWKKFEAEVINQRECKNIYPYL
ncbi:M1 family metallopeptidase [Mucilaginibacter sp. MD40]|uniref:M1 family metallopeptidase n=1 Tax=Mucilaginibacter sp. MD40 TaxID=2029590 RepID=UPI00117C01F8|nr:M1 family metallopeptidase [Mucilaginibacter sp. MD40]